MELQTGYKIRGHYEIVKSLGQGGFGIVYLVKDLDRLREYKVIKELFAREFSNRAKDGLTVVNKRNTEILFQKIKEDIEREINILSKLDNKNIIKADGFFEENSTVYSIMEFIEGEDLEKYLEHHSFNEVEAKDLLKQLIHGLKEIHNQNIIHRDIKPNNIIKANNGVYKIIDFTTNRSYSDGAITTVTGFQNKLYTPPELVQQKNTTIGNYSDIYSLGMTLVSILVKDRNTLPMLVDRFIENSEFIRLIDTLDVSRNFKLVLIKMTELKAENRFQNLEEIEKRLFQTFKRKNKFNTKKRVENIETEFIDNISEKEIEPKSSWFKKIVINSLFLGSLASAGYLYLHQELIPQSIISLLVAPKPFSQENIEAFLEEYMELEEQDRAEDTLPYFAPLTNFYNRENMTHEAIYQSKNAFYKKWFKRKFELLDVSITRRYKEEGISYCEITRKMRWEHTSNSRFMSGIAIESVILKQFKDTFQIVSIGNIKNKINKSISLVEPKIEKHSFIQRVKPKNKGLEACQKISYRGRFFSDKALNTCKKVTSITGQAFVARAIFQLGDEERGLLKFRRLSYDLMEKCDQGSSNACNLLGFYFLEKKEYQKSSKYYQKGCDLNSAFGCSWMGYLYENAKGVSQNFNHAINLYSKGCRGNNEFGCSSLGGMYLHAKGTEQDYEKALSFYTKGCKLGSNFGCSNLAYMYKTGKGVEKNYTMAVEFYKKGCKLGSNFGCTDLGYMYKNGLGCDKDFVRAKEVYSKACILDEKRGCYSLAEMYKKGQGGKVDLIKAKKSYRKSCNLGYNKACI